VRSFDMPTNISSPADYYTSFFPSPA
jgi:hypothetical protein